MTTFNSGFGHGFEYAYFIGIYVAPLLMAVALWRSRAVPRWLAVLFFAGLEIAQQQISSGPVVVLYMLPFAAAMVLLAARIWQAAALPARLRAEPGQLDAIIATAEAMTFHGLLRPSPRY